MSISYALEQAKTLIYRRGYYRVCAVASIGPTIVSVGRNSYTKTHPLQAMYAEMVGMFDRIFLHAEIDALIRARCQVTDLYVARVTKDGKPAMAKPCPICRLAMRRCGVLRVHYTTDATTVVTEIVRE